MRAEKGDRLIGGGGRRCSKPLLTAAQPEPLADTVTSMLKHDKRWNRTSCFYEINNTADRFASIF